MPTVNVTAFEQQQRRDGKFSMSIRLTHNRHPESVEVVRGVASARYGGMSSGAIVVNTKKGRTPYEVR